MNDPQLKSYVVQVATSLAMQIKSRRGLAEIGFVGDLCRHLRKSLQATSEFVGEQDLNLNITLQNSIENCLLEIADGVGPPPPSQKGEKSQFTIYPVSHSAFHSLTKLLLSFLVD